MTQVLIEMSSAPCVQKQELFFPETIGEDGWSEPAAEVEPYLEAKALCAGCPNTDSCREFALSNKIEVGVWGELTPQERGVWVLGAPVTPEDYKKYINPDKWYFANELAKHLKINQITLSKAVRAGVVPPPVLTLKGRFLWEKSGIHLEDIRENLKGLK
jgi:hypothetical protein